MNNEIILKFFANYIESQLGIVYVEANYYQLEHRLVEIKTQLGLENLEELYKKGQQGIDGQFKVLLLDLATNNETSFFRDINIFKAFSQKILQDKINENNNNLNIWSAASSSGQEIYSVLMEIDQMQEAYQFHFDLNFLASDVSEMILKRAQNGVYSQLDIQRGLPAKLLIKYFTKNDNDYWEFNHPIKRKVNFKKLNLLDTWGEIGTFDVIFCRNVLIYQSVSNKIKIIGELTKKLKPQGFLVLGAAESLFGLSDSYNQIAYSNAVFYQKK
ncbi:MAG: CheR family methyltransferase [Bacteriovoracaceae bacterium]